MAPRMTRSSAHGKRTLPRRFRLGLLIALAGSAWTLLGALSTPAFAQTAPPLPAPDGRDFAGRDLPAPPQKGDAIFSARRVSTWSIPGRRLGATGLTTSPTRRLMLDQDVVVRIGSREFRARRATAWIEPVQTEGLALEQIAVYMEGVTDPGAAVGFSHTAERLLVTAIIEGEVRLRAALLSEGRPPSRFLEEAESRFSRYLRGLGGAAAAPGVTTPLQSRGGVPTDDGVGLPTGDDLPPVAQPPPITPSEGIVTFYGPDRTLVTADDENSLVITGGVVMQYTDPAKGRSLQIRADSMVVFLEPGGVMDLLRFGPGEVRGVYLEGDVVATDGAYTLRGPRLFYDLRSNRGLALDAVFWAYDEERGLPLYVRADAIRQESERQWSAGKARLTNTSFFEPTFSIGASDVTVTRAPRETGADRYHVAAKDVTVSAEGLPVFYLPSYRGDAHVAPLKRLTYTTKNSDPALLTRWDLLALLGVDDLPGLDIDLLLDGYFERGPGVGLDATWGARDAQGAAFGYYIHDEGVDELASGAEVEPERENRGMFLGEHRWRLDQEWTLFMEASWISDPTFVDAFFRGLGETRREFTNSAYARRLEENTLFSFEARGTLNDFTPNEHILQSLGYQVQRFPELTYWRVGDDLLDGWVTYSGQNSLSLLALNFNERTPAEQGFDTPARSQAALGLDPDTPIGDALRAQGLTENSTLRFDSRHEFSLPIQAGDLTLTPFMVGRLTAYDDDFSELRGPDGDSDEVRLWGAAGVRAATEIVHVDNSVKSELFDLDRIRHIIQPFATLWSSATSLEADDLPLYDKDVEGISTGTAMNVGVTNTWQTRRGGPEGDHSVDWLTLRTDYTWASSDTDRFSPIGRYVEYRPEQSNFGEFATAAAAMSLTDSVSLSSTAVYDVEFGKLSMLSAGALFDHGYGFSTFIEARKISALDSTYLNFGAAYELTRKYAIRGHAEYDIEESQFQFIGARLARRFPQWTLEFGIEYDDIQDDVSFSVGLDPAGLGGDARARVYTRPTDAFGDPAPVTQWRSGR